MVTDNATMNIKEVKHCEAEDALVFVGEEDDGGDDNDVDDNDGDSDGDVAGDNAGEGAFPFRMVIFTFIP